MEEIIISAQHVTKTYDKKKALNDVSIQVKRGDIYGLVGNNGAGKTTLMRLINGQSIVESGEIKLFGATSGPEMNAARRRTGNLIEAPGFYADMTAKENLEYFRIQFGIPGKHTVDQVLEEVGLEDAGKTKYKNFSLGMKQRLGIALTLMNSPELLILDEPINGLDPAGIIEVRNTILNLNHKRNVTILISSHILAELSNIATQYGFLCKGKLLEEISADDLMQKCENYLDVEVTDVAKMSVILENELQIKKFRVYPDSHLHLYEGFHEIEKISKAAITHGIGLLGINKKTVDLENYYMNLLGGAAND